MADFNGPVVRRFTRSCAQGLPNIGDSILTSREPRVRFTVVAVERDGVTLSFGLKGLTTKMSATRWGAWCRETRAVRELRS